MSTQPTYTGKKLIDRPIGEQAVKMKISELRSEFNSEIASLKEELKEGILLELSKHFMPKEVKKGL